MHSQCSVQVQCVRGVLHGDLVRFPTAKESWKACVFVGNLNIWGSCKIALILGFPSIFCFSKNVVLDRIPVTSQWLFVGAVCIPPSHP